MFILTASRELAGKKQKLMMTVPQYLVLTDKTLLSYFNDLRPSDVSDVNFEQINYVSNGVNDSDLAGWFITMVIKITDNNKDSPRTMIVPAQYIVSGSITAADMYNQLNTAFHNHQNISIVPPLDLNGSAVFVESIIVNV